MKHVIVHNLEVAPSRELIEKAFTDYQRRYSRYNPALTWRDARKANFSFTAKGMTLTGALELRSNELEVEMEVPLLLRVFKAQALRILDREVTRLLTPPRAT